jgi:hypothetical protein
VFPHEYQRALKTMNATTTADATIAKAKTKTATVPAK